MTATSSTATRVLVDDPRKLRRAALVALLSKEANLSVDTRSNGADLIEAARSSFPHVLVLCGVDVLDRCRMVKDQSLDTHVLVVASAECRASLLEAIEAGADGFVDADASRDELMEAVAALANDRAWISPDMLGPLLRAFIDRRRTEDMAQQRFERLSPRERDVLRLLARGYDGPAIAGALGVSPQTARTHVQRVLGKLEVHSRLEAVSFAVEHGFVEEG